MFVGASRLLVNFTASMNAGFVQFALYSSMASSLAILLFLSCRPAVGKVLAICWPEKPHYPYYTFSRRGMLDAKTSDLMNFVLDKLRPMYIQQSYTTCSCNTPYVNISAVDFTLASLAN